MLRHTCFNTSRPPDIRLRSVLLICQSGAISASRIFEIR
ncbi:hypothetical protein FBUS_01699 [Fasciolopsis buskii]|uniref:Uncharacterized protein n=1 Tax=Fasciolopsis buskii TaxID=27845 RepID=A0A8E0VM13_9TREM|nr:hypothetical protein FBUS_01699 [Fasciolopsis buski]